MTTIDLNDPHLYQARTMELPTPTVAALATHAPPHFGAGRPDIADFDGSKLIEAGILPDMPTLTRRMVRGNSTAHLGPIRQAAEVISWHEAVESVHEAHRRDGRRVEDHRVDLTRCTVEYDEDRLILIERTLGSPRFSQEWLLRDRAISQLCSQIKIPVRFIKGLPLHAAQDVFNWCLKNRGREDVLIRGSVVGERTEARAILSAKYARFDDKRFLDIVGSELGRHRDLDGIKVARVTTGLVTSIDVRLREVTNRYGLPRYAGVTFRNSELGLSSTSASAFLFDLFCTNGMYDKSSIAYASRRHVGDPSDNVRDIVSRIDDILDGAEALSAALTHAETVPMSASAIVSRLSQARLSEDLRDTVMGQARHEAWVRESVSRGASAWDTYRSRADDEVYAALADFTAADMIHGLTATARDLADERRRDQADDLEALAGRLTSRYVGQA